MFLPSSRSLILVACLLAAPSGFAEGPRAAERVGSGRLADGGFDAPRLESRAASATRGLPVEPVALLRARLARRAELAVPEPPPLARPKAIGDRLVLSQDDGRLPPLDATEEARLAASPGLAGASDFVAARFPARALASRPPFRVSEVLLGLDNLHGATTWPLVEVRVEDGSAPLDPRGGSLVASVTDFDAPAAGLTPAPVGSTSPTLFQRLRLGLPDLDVPDAWLSDGAFDDDFARTDEPLSNPTSDWLECVGANCQSASSFLAVASGRVVRGSATAASLGVKFPALAVDDVRPAFDLDLDVSVQLDLSAGTATRAGLAVRTAGVDAYYRVEYVKASDVVAVDAVTPGGTVPLGSFPVAAPSDTPLLGVRVEGVNPSVTLTCFVGGVQVGQATDSTYRFSSALLALVASDAASSGEAWDDLVAQRRPDVHVVVQLPPGEQAAIPLDVSDDSLQALSVSTSSDGVLFTPRPAGTGCLNPGNPTIQLEVEDTVGDRLFQNEAHVVKLELPCATCPTTRNLCVENAGSAERREPVHVVGEAFDVRVSWWNENLSAGDGLLLRASLWPSACWAVGALGGPEAVLESVVGATGSQPLLGAQVLRRDVGQFTPAFEGEYCVIVEELHDTNADCCPDGEETNPLPGATCPGACTPIAGSDSNPTTRIVLRDVRVEAPCTPLPAGMSNLACDSLRVAQEVPGDPLPTRLSWGVVDTAQFPDQYNVHLMEGRRFDAALRFEELAPIVDRPVGLLTRVLELATPGPGRPLWMAIFQTDGCPSADSLQDPVPCP